MKIIRNLFSVISILGITVVLLSCGSLIKKRKPIQATQSAKERFQTIIKSKKSRKYKIQKLNMLKLSEPETDIVDDINLALGDINYKSRNFKEAFASYMLVSQSEFFSPKEAESLYFACRSLYKLGQFDEALALSTKALPLSEKNPELVNRINRLRFALQKQTHNNIGALKSLISISEMSPNESERKAAKSRAIDYLDSKLNAQEIAQVADSSDFKDLQAFALFRIGETHFENKNFSDAKSSLSDIADIVPDSDIAEQAAKILKQIDAQRKVNPMTIGVILPLSGRHSKVAYRTLRGLQLGLGIYGKNRSNFKLAVIDSEGNPDIARRAVERLVVEDHVIGIVGSLLSKTSVAVASKADELGVPSIALSQKSGITDVGSTVFRNALTSELQVRQLVRTAMEDFGLKRFAILYPNDRYGIEYANLFWDEVLARGGEIRAAQSYDGKKKLFSGPIQRLVGTYYLEDRREEYRQNLTDWLKRQKIISRRINPPNELLPPIIDFEALFIPDTIPILDSIAPTLAYHDISHLMLLGTNLWNSQRLVKRSKALVEGSLFVDSLLSSDPTFKNSAFYREYKSVFGTEPGIFAAQAYDAGLIIRQAISSGETSRIGLAEQIAGTKKFSGSLGELHVSKRRELIRPLVSLKVTDGKIQALQTEPHKIK